MRLTDTGLLRAAWARPIGRAEPGVERDRQDRMIRLGWLMPLSGMPGMLAITLNGEVELRRNLSLKV